MVSLEEEERSTKAICKRLVKTAKSPICKPMREALEEIKLADALVLDVWLPEL